MRPRVQLTVQLRAICASRAIAKALDFRASAPCETARPHRFPNPVHAETAESQCARTHTATYRPRTFFPATQSRLGARSQRLPCAIASAIAMQVRP